MSFKILNKSFLLLVTIFIFTDVIESVNADSHEWFLDEQNFASAQYASRLQDAITAEPPKLTQGQLQILFNNDRLSVETRATILNSITDDNQRRVVFLNALGTVSEQRLISIIENMGGPNREFSESQFYLLRSLTHDDAGSRITQHYALLDRIMQTGIHITVKRAFFSLSTHENGIDLSQFENSITRFARDVGRVNLIMRNSEGVLVGNLQYSFTENGEFFIHQAAQLRVDAIEGARVKVTPTGFEIVRQENQQGRFELNSGSLIIHDGNLALQGNAEPFPLSSFISAPGTNFRFSLSTVNQDVLTIDNLNSCAGGTCARVNFVTDPRIHSSISFHNGMFAVQYLNEQGVNRRYYLDMANGEIDVIASRDTIMRNGQQFEFGRLQIKNIRGDALINIRDGNGREMPGLQQVVLRGPSSYVSMHDELRQQELQIIHNGIGRTSASTSADRGQRAVHEFDATNKIAYYYSGDSPLSKAAFDEYARFRVIPDIIDLFVYNRAGIGSTTVQAEGEQTYRVINRDLINLVIVHQSLDVSNPRIWMRADYADGTRDPATLQTTVYDGVRVVDQRVASILNADFGLDFRRVDIRTVLERLQGARENIVMQIVPQIHLIRGPLIPSTLRDQARTTFYSNKDNYVILTQPVGLESEWMRYATGELVRTVRMFGQGQEESNQVILGQRHPILTNGVVTGFYYNEFRDSATGELIRAEDGIIRERVIEAAGYRGALADRDRPDSARIVFFNSLGRHFVAELSGDDLATFQKAEVHYDKTIGTETNRIGLGSQLLIDFVQRGTDSFVASLHIENNQQVIEMTQGRMWFRNYQEGLRTFFTRFMDGNVEQQFVDEPDNGAVFSINGIVDVRRADILLSVADGRMTITGGGDIQDAVQFGAFTLRGNRFLTNPQNGESERQVDFTFTSNRRTRESNIQFNLRGMAQFQDVSIPVTLAFQTAGGPTTFTLTGTAGSSAQGRGVIDISPSGGISISDFRASLMTDVRETVLEVSRAVIRSRAGGIQVISESDSGPAFSLRETVDGRTRDILSAQRFDAIIRTGDDVFEITNLDARALRAIGVGVASAESAIDVQNIRAERITVQPQLMLLSGVSGSGSITVNGQTLATVTDVRDLSATIRYNSEVIRISDLYASYVNYALAQGNLEARGIRGRIEVPVRTINGESILIPFNAELYAHSISGNLDGNQISLQEVSAIAIVNPTAITATIRTNRPSVSVGELLAASGQSIQIVLDRVNPDALSIPGSIRNLIAAQRAGDSRLLTTFGDLALTISGQSAGELRVDALTDEIRFVVNGGTPIIMRGTATVDIKTEEVYLARVVAEIERGSTLTSVVLADRNHIAALDGSQTRIQIFRLDESGQIPVDARGVQIAAYSIDINNPNIRFDLNSFLIEGSAEFTTSFGQDSFRVSGTTRGTYDLAAGTLTSTGSATVDANGALGQFRVLGDGRIENVQYEVYRTEDGRFGFRLPGQNIQLGEVTLNLQGNGITVDLTNPDPLFDFARMPQDKSTISTRDVGTSYDVVKHMQAALGINDDGYFGQQTSRALRQFQRDNGLRVTGVLDATTLSRIEQERFIRSIDVEATRVLNMMDPGTTAIVMRGEDSVRFRRDDNGDYQMVVRAYRVPVVGMLFSSSGHVVSERATGLSAIQSTIRRLVQQYNSMATTRANTRTDVFAAN